MKRLPGGGGAPCRSPQPTARRACRRGTRSPATGRRTRRRPARGLAALLGEAVGASDELDERQLLGAGSAARRLRAHADYLEVMAVAEFARRRAEQLEASKARGDRVRSRDGEYPAEELGFEMTASAYSAGLLLDMAANIVGRLPGHPGGDGGRA